MTAWFCRMVVERLVAISVSSSTVLPESSSDCAGPEGEVDGRDGGGGVVGISSLVDRGSTLGMFGERVVGQVDW